MTKIKAKSLLSKSPEDLKEDLRQLKKELAELRVAQVTNGGASKLSQIGVVRKNIARVLTVFNQKRRSETKAALQGQKYMPKDLRPKLTRRIRQRNFLAKNLKTKTVKQEKACQAFPMRKFALKL